MKKLVVFDLDGTLLDSIEDLAYSCDEILKRHGFPSHTYDEYRSFVGNGVKKLLERSLPEKYRKDDDYINKLLCEFLEYYHEHIDHYTTPYNGIKELLEALYSRGVKTAVLSNKYHAGTCKLVEKFFYNTPFFYVTGHKDDFPLKPNPASLDNIIQRAGVSKKEVLYVGDTPTDIKTGHAADVDTIAVTWGFRTRCILEEEKPTYIADTPLDILRYV